jgi:quercetin dioxygenase-like cupin family protein
MAHAGDEIFNPRTGQRMVFRQTAADTGGSLLQVESTHPSNQPPEPMHVHPRQESRAMVTEGALHFRVGGNERVVPAGESIVIPLSTPHQFWNAGPETARSVQEFRPALRIEEFSETYFALARDHKLDAKGMPSLLRLAVMIPAFSEEIRTTSPPWPLTKAMTWVLGPLARARGYRRTYP